MSKKGKKNIFQKVSKIFKNKTVLYITIGVIIVIIGIVVWGILTNWKFGAKTSQNDIPDHPDHGSSVYCKVDNCKNCQRNDESCELCYPGYTVENGKCVKKEDKHNCNSDQCKKCDVSGKKCIDCKGDLHNDKNGKCCTSENLVNGVCCESAGIINGIHTCCSNDGKKFSKSPNGKYTKCCESGILDNNGKCCAKTDGLDGKGFCCPKNDICGNGVCCQNGNKAYNINDNNYACKDSSYDEETSNVNTSTSQNPTECQKKCGNTNTYCEEHETCDNGKCVSNSCKWIDNIPTYTPLMMTGKTCKNNNDCMPYGTCNQEGKCQIDTFGILENNKYKENINFIFQNNDIKQPNGETYRFQRTGELTAATKTCTKMNCDVTLNQKKVSNFSNLNFKYPTCTYNEEPAEETSNPICPFDDKTRCCFIDSKFTGQVCNSNEFCSTNSKSDLGTCVPNTCKGTNGKICNGNGTCVNGKCQCGETGNECSTFTNNTACSDKTIDNNCCRNNSDNKNFTVDCRGSNCVNKCGTGGQGGQGGADCKQVCCDQQRSYCNTFPNNLTDPAGCMFIRGCGWK